MDAETEFDTDIMILDYTCCKATYELLVKRIAELGDKPARAENSLLSIFDSWRSITSAKHSARSISRDLQAKLELLTFTVRFISRARRSEWTSNNNNIHTPTILQAQSPSFSNADYNALLGILKIPRQDRLENRHNVLSLMHLFPDLLRLCSAMAAAAAAATDSDSDPDSGTAPPSLSFSSLTDLLGQWLLQAVIEQYTIFGRMAYDARNDAVRLAGDTIEQRKEKELPINTDIISQYTKLISPSHPGVSLEAHFNHLVVQLPTLEAFESMVMMQLQDFLFGLATPVLVKLETGELYSA